MRFDYSKLRGRIVEVCGTQSAFSEAIGLSQRTISLKLSNRISWRQNEIEIACDLLRIPKEDIPVYFFAEKV